jgi:hypothetical protein
MGSISGSLLQQTIRVGKATMSVSGPRKSDLVVGAAFVFFVVVTVVNAAGVFGPILADMRNGNASGLAQKIGGLLIAAQVFGVGLVLIGLACVPASHLAWYLKRRYPSDVTFLGTSETDLRAAMRAAAGTAAPAPIHLSFAMVASNDGLTVWTGSLKPRILYRFPWATVTNIGWKEIGSGPMKVKALSLAIDNTQGRTELAFPVRDDALLSVTRRNQSELEDLVHSLKAIRPHQRSGTGE